MYRINPGMQLWWNRSSILFDFFKRKYGEPVRCLEFQESHQIVVIRTLSGREDRLSSLYLKTSPN